MLKKLVNQCTFELELETKEPLLVKSGSAVVNGPDMTFVRTRRGGRTEPFIPGSSLKGVLRSHAERVARTLSEDSVCGVFDSANVEGCSWRFDSSKGPADYAHSCPACRLFGSLHWKGRFRTGDAYLTDEHRDVQPELRDGIGIDRVSGGVARGAKFDLEVMPAGVRFATRFDVVNFEAWQLGWIAYVLRDLVESNLRIGMGTSRGLGRVQAHLNTITLEYIGEPEELGASLPGLGALVSDEERSAYGLVDGDRVDCPEGIRLQRPAGSLRSRVELHDTDDQMTLLAEFAPAWDAYVKTLTPLS